MPIRMKSLLLAAAIFAACGGDEEPEKTKTVVKAEPEPKDVVAEIKLQFEEYRDYYYCDEPYPQTCAETRVQVQQAYVLEREDDGPFRVVLFNNQDRASTWAEFIYLTVDMETKKVSDEGSFKWREFAGQLEREGKPLWGIPE